MKDLTHDKKATFWNRLDDVRAGMLHTDMDRVVPMTHYTDEKRGVLWFITAEGTDAWEAATSGKPVHYVVAEANAKIYARIDGTLAVSEDKEKLDELWSPVAAAWFEEGREDPDVRLIMMRPHKAEVWLTDGAAGFLYEIAKANLTHDTPDAGDHGVVRF